MGNDFSLPNPFAWIDIPGKGYSIAKYPLTNAQYATFVEAGGYNQRHWWSDEGWDARLKGLAFEWGTGNSVPTDTPWTEPRYWSDPTFNGAEQPVVGITWYEATAFCQWLSDATREKITLPTEDQWQYAAQGDDGRIYPWGDEWDCERCNNSVKPCQSAATTPVRQYEGKGDSPFGVVDMAGNVWEWCSIHDDETTDSQLVKGGGWFYYSTADCRCNFRYEDSPIGCYNFRGFRISRS